MDKFKLMKLETEARKNWDRFYRRNSSNFFKDRNWTSKEIHIMFEDVNLENEHIFIEAGCGCGNAIFPLALSFQNWIFYGIDFSENAITLLEKRSDTMNLSARIGTKVMDLTNDITTDCLRADLPSADIISLIFVLSSISPSNHHKVICNLKLMLKRGGSIIFRDYGASDHAMQRFSTKSMISERFYARQDGTRAYYFFADELQKTFEECGFQTIKCEYKYRNTENLKEQLCIKRTFVDGRFILK